MVCTEHSGAEGQGARQAGTSRQRVGSGRAWQDMEPSPEQALAVPAMAPGRRRRGQAACPPGAYSSAEEVRPSYRHRGGRLKRGQKAAQGTSMFGCLAPPRHESMQESTFQDVPLLPTQVGSTQATHSSSGTFPPLHI